MQRLRVNNESFYSFALAGNRKKGPDENNVTSIYNGEIMQKSYPRSPDDFLTDSDSSLYDRRNGCC